MNSFEYKGYWFLPNDKEHPVAGTLTFDTNGCSLEVIGSLVGNKTAFESALNGDKREIIPIIHGVTNTAKKVTLINGYSKGFSHNFSVDFPIERYGCSYIMVGRHLDHLDECVFDRISLRFTPLSRWLPPERISKTYEFDKSISIIVDTEEGSNIAVKELVNDSFQLSLLYCVEYKGDHYKPYIEQYTELHIESISEKVSFSELLYQSKLFIDFISMLSNEISIPILIQLHDKNDYQQVKDVKYYSNYQLYYGEANSVIEDSKGNFLLEYNKITSEFPEIIRKWYNISIDLAPIRTLLIDSIQAKTNFTSINFLIVIQALEGFHRRFIDPQKKSLKNRLKELIRKYENVTIIPDLQINEKAVADSRNYYSHFYNKNEVPDLLDGVELYYLTQKLRILLTCCLLSLVGFEVDTINKINWHDLYSFA